VFSLLFPEEDIKRRYDMQETRLAGWLADCFGIRKDALTMWSDEGKKGSLGVEVKKVLEARWTVSLSWIVAPLLLTTAIGIGG
jgi:hypothetical protein